MPSASGPGGGGKHLFKRGTYLGTNVSEDTRRPLVAGLLSFLQPGLGHLYLRLWVRALLWFGLWIATVLLVVPRSGEPATLGALADAVTGIADQPLDLMLTLVSVTVFSTIDAFWLARRATPIRSEEPQCRECGKEIDPELGFCVWCTESVDADQQPD